MARNFNRDGDRDTVTLQGVAAAGRSQLCFKFIIIKLCVQVPESLALALPLAALQDLGLQA